MSVVDVRLQRYQGLLWSLLVDVAGVPRTFLLDLGAGVTTLDSELADELGLVSTGSCTGRRMTGAEVALTLHEGIELRLGSTRLHPTRLASFGVAALLPPDWPPVHGVLALDALEHVPFTLDLASDVLTLETQQSLETRIATGHELDVRLHRQIPDVSLDVMVAVDARGSRLWFELDNSNTGPVVVSATAAVALGVADDDTDVILDVPGLGDVATPVVIRPIIYDGNLGRSVLDGRVLSFDLARGRVVAAVRTSRS